MTKQKTLTPSALFNDFQLLIILFISFRFMLLMVYQPILGEDFERGIGTGGDRVYHYFLSELAEDGNLPFRDWWSEFPPLWYLTTSSVYLLLGENVSYTSWFSALGILMILSETGILILMRKIGAQLHNPATGMALAWIYALTLAPMVFMWWNFDSLVSFFLLLGIWWFIQQKEVRSAVAIAIGAYTKFVPFLIFGAIFRFRQIGFTIRYMLISVGVFIALYIPLFLVNSELTAVSLTAQFGKPSYETVWAILDGNYTTGNFGSIESHFDPDGAQILDKEPALVPSWLRLGVAGLIGLFVFWRTKRLDSIGLVAFVGITLLIFYVQSQGWSPQWIVQIIPLTLLVFPNRNGVIVTILLSLLAFAEYPVLFIQTGDTGGVIEGALRTPWIAVVTLRTALLVALAIGFYQKLRQLPDPEKMIAE